MSTPLGVTKAEAFAPNGVLQQGYHEPLWEDLDRLAQTAGLVGASRRYVWESCRPHLDKEEIARGSEIKARMKVGQMGVVYGGSIPKVSERFMSLTGSFLRNYVNARYMTLAQVLEEFRRNQSVDATILLIPDFHLPMGGEIKVQGVQKGSQGGVASKPQWVTEAVAGLLLDRISTGRYTYLYSDDVERLGKDYGSYVDKLIMENFEMKLKAGPAVGGAA